MRFITASIQGRLLIKGGFLLKIYGMRLWCTFLKTDCPHILFSCDLLSNPTTQEKSRIWLYIFISYILLVISAMETIYSKKKEKKKKDTQTISSLSNRPFIVHCKCNGRNNAISKTICKFWFSNLWIKSRKLKLRFRF